MDEQPLWTNRLLRFLHSMPAIACLALCALSIVFWARSYRWINKASVSYATGGAGNFGAGPIPQYRSFHLSAKDGCLVLQRDSDYVIVPGQEDQQTGVTIWPSHQRHASQRWPKLFVWGFAYERSSLGQVAFSTPLWFLSVTTGAAGALLWLKRPYRFTLRGVLIATTFVAIVLGIGVALSR